MATMQIHGWSICIKSLSLQFDLHLGKRKVLHRAKLDEYGEWVTTSILFCFLPEILAQWQQYVAIHCHDGGTNHSCTRHFLLISSLIYLIMSLEHCINGLAKRNQLCVDNPFNVKERNQHKLDIVLHLSRFIWTRRRWILPLRWLLFIFKIVP